MYTRTVTGAPNEHRPTERTAEEATNSGVNFFDLLVRFTRAWGLCTAIVLYGVAIEDAYYRRTSGYYLLGASTILIFLESAWIVTLFLQLCVRDQHSKFLKCWQAVQWVQHWKKSLFYVPMGIGPIIWARGFWMAYAAGVGIFALAFFHFVLTFQNCRLRIHKRRIGNSDIDSFESSRFEEVLDDGIPEPIPTSSHLLDVLHEQDTTLLEI